MDLQVLKATVRWVRVCPVIFLLLTVGKPCLGTDEPASQSKETPPAVKIDNLLKELYPNQSELFNSLSATTKTLETSPASPDLPTLVNPKAQSAGSLIIHNRKPILPLITPESDGMPTTATESARWSVEVTSSTLTRMKRDFLLPQTLRQLQLAGMATPYVPLTLPSGLNLAALLAPIGSATRMEKNPAIASVAVATPRAPLPEKPSAQVLAPDSTTLSNGAIDVNKADADEIMEKLNLDARRARLVIQFRTLYGPFRTPEDLTQVNGINDDQVRKWENAGLLRF